MQGHDDWGLSWPVETLPDLLVRIVGLSNCCLQTLRERALLYSMPTRLNCAWCDQPMRLRDGAWERPSAAGDPPEERRENAG